MLIPQHLPRFLSGWRCARNTPPSGGSNWPDDGRTRTSACTVLLGALGLLVCLASGCRRQDELSSPTARRMRGLATVYLDFAVARGSGPANEQQLLAHMARLPRFALEEYSLEAAGTALRSERDQQPLTVRYGLAVTQLSGADSPWLAYESRGVEGRRLVVYLDTHVDCLDEQQFRERIGPP